MGLFSRIIQARVSPKVQIMKKRMPNREKAVSRRFRFSLSTENESSHGLLPREVRCLFDVKLSLRVVMRIKEKFSPLAEANFTRACKTPTFSLNLASAPQRCVGGGAARSTAELAHCRPFRTGRFIGALLGGERPWCFHQFNIP